MWGVEANADALMSSAAMVVIIFISSFLLSFRNVVCCPNTGASTKVTKKTVSERPSAEIFVLPILMPRDSDALLLGWGGLIKRCGGFGSCSFFLKYLDMREINVSFVENN